MSCLSYKSNNVNNTHNNSRALTSVDLILTQASLLYDVFVFSMFPCQAKSCLPSLTGTFPLKLEAGWTQRSRLHGGNIGQESRIMDMGIGSVLGKVSCVDKPLRDSWNGNGVSQSIRRVKPWGGAEVVVGGVGGWTAWWYLHHWPNPPSIPVTNRTAWTMHICFTTQASHACKHLIQWICTFNPIYGKSCILYTTAEYLANQVWSVSDFYMDLFHLPGTHWLPFISVWLKINWWTLETFFGCVIHHREQQLCNLFLYYIL